jgi:hypothetical protein
MGTKYHYNLQTFYNEDAISYYLLGAFITDGSVSSTNNRIELTSIDGDWLILINNLICKEKPIAVRYGKYHRICYSSEKIKEWLVGHGCGPKKSLTLDFPKIPDKYLPDFLRGCWDGDGNFHLSRKYYASNESNIHVSASISSGSELFATKISKILSDMNIKNKIYVPKIKPRIIKGAVINSNNKHYNVNVSGFGSICRLIHFMYYTNDIISMPRKRKITNEIVDYWERKFYCKRCGELMIVGIASRGNAQFCDICRPIQKEERRKIKRIENGLL